MNNPFVIVGSAIAATLATVTVITIQRPDMPAGNAELIELSRSILEEQQSLRSNVAEMVSVQREMLQREQREAATVQREIDKSRAFFEQNMGIPQSGR